MDELSRAHYDMESIISNIVTILENCKSIGDSLDYQLHPNTPHIHPHMYG